MNLKLDELKKSSDQFDRRVTEAVPRVHAMPGFGFPQPQTELSGADSGNASTHVAAESALVDLPELPPAEAVVRDVEGLLRQNRET